MAKSSPLAAGLSRQLREAAGHSPAATPALETPRKRKSQPLTVLIGGHFTPEVRRTLLLVQAERDNAGKSLKDLLGEAINDLCVKYGKPQPFQPEDTHYDIEL